MGPTSRYASVSQSDEAQEAVQLHNQTTRSDKARAQDFDDASSIASLEDGVDDVDDGDLLGWRRSTGRGTRRGFSRAKDGSMPSCYTLVKRALLLGALVIFSLALGFCVGSKHQQRKGCSAAAAGDGSSKATNGHKGDEGGLLPPQSLVPDLPIKPVKFGFPTPYENTSVEADKLWEGLMPIGEGFIRVPYPRRYDMPPSKPMENDTEQAEIYSLSSLHQIHCLYVIRDVIKHYQHPNYDELGPSRFSGHGHEWHCVDYIRQAIMCAADTTLDFAEVPHVEPDGTVVKVSRGFTGNNSTHLCRNWDAMVDWAIENRATDKTSIG